MLGQDRKRIHGGNDRITDACFHMHIENMSTHEGKILTIHQTLVCGIGYNIPGIPIVGVHEPVNTAKSVCRIIDPDAKVCVIVAGRIVFGNGYVVNLA